MTIPEPYDLLVVLAGNKIARHPPAVELMRRGWARHLTVTGEYEHIDFAPDLAEQILAAPPSSSTAQDALAIRSLVEQHRFDTVLVVTGGPHVTRAQLTLRRAFAGLPTRVDVLAWESACDRALRAESPLPALWRGFGELVKLVYYLARHRA